MAAGQLGKVVEQVRGVVAKHDAAGMTDGDLLKLYVQGRDETAFAALLRRHGPMVMGVCRRVLGNPSDAEDAFQATFLVLVRKASTLRSPGMVGNWLYGVAYRTALEAKKAARKRRAKEAKVVPRTATVEDAWADLRRVLDQELELLPDKYRAVVVLCDVEGKTRKEAARHLGWAEGTVASRLATARTRLAKRLGGRGLAISGGALAVLLAEKASACVPAAVASSTIKAAGLFATGKAAAGVMPAKVTALTEGVLKTMLLTKLKTLMVLAGLLGVVALAVGLSAYHGFAQQPPANENKKEPVKRAAEGPATKDAAKPDEKKSEPYYCCLVFGPKGKVRALVRVDGDEVCVDRDGDGKFDGKGERFKSEKDCKDVEIADADGKTSYVITFVHVLHTTPPEKFLEVRVRNRGPLDYPQGCIVTMAADQKAAPEAHFNGPLTVTPNTWRIVNRASRLVENDLVDVGPLLPQSLKQLAGKGLIVESTLPKSLKRAGEPTTLSVAVNTEGDSSFVAVCSPDNKDRDTSPFGKGIHPVADVEFPAKKPGDPPVKKRYPLDQFCCDGGFKGPVRVPDEAGVGKAKVTFSFDAWKGAKVAPTTFKIPVDDPQ